MKFLGWGMGDFLARLAGAREQVLAQCPTERVKFQGLGSAILITSCVATVSMWFALDSAMGISPIAALPAALLWGVVILGIDRWLVTSLPPTGRRRLTIALPRVILALLLGTLISTPIVLRAFQGEINTQISLIKQQRASAFLNSQQHSKVSQQVTNWTNQVNNLDKVINSGGQQALNPSADPVIKSLTKQENTELGLEQKYYQQWQCQLYGGCGSPKGNGPLAQASHQSYLQAKQAVTNIQNQVTGRQNVLSATDKNSQATRLQQAESALPNAKAQLANAQAQETALRNSFENNNLATNGLLIRLQALNELSAGDFTLNSTRFLLFLFFLVIECLPITVKLLQRPGIYEEILQATAERELSDAKRAIRSRRAPAAVPTQAQAQEPAGAPASPANEAHAAHGTSERDLAREAWRTRPAVPKPSRPASPSWRTAPTVTSPGNPDTAGSRSQLDRVLREMNDARRTPTAPAGYSKGSELSYDDDDL
jgi:Domain of unknown function (DUF4407)